MSLTRPRTVDLSRNRKTETRLRRYRPSFDALEDRCLMAVSALSLAASDLISDTAAGNVQGPASVSANGRYVVYTNSAANLSDSTPSDSSTGEQVMDSLSAMNVFLFDRQTGQTTLVSHAHDSSTTTARGSSFNPVISADGNYVAYVSNSDNLISGAKLANEVYYVSMGSVSGGSFTLSYGGATTAAIAYNADAATVQSALTGLSTVGSGNATVSGSGGNSGIYTITFTGALGHGAAEALTVNSSSLTYPTFPLHAFRLSGGEHRFLCDQYNVYLYNVQTGANTLVSHGASDQGTGYQKLLGEGDSGFLDGDGVNEPNLPATQRLSVSISGDGKYVVYLSAAKHLVDGQQPTSTLLDATPANVFLYDRSNDKNILISHTHNSATTEASGWTNGAVINTNGDAIAFTAQAFGMFSGHAGSNDGGSFVAGEFQQVFWARQNSGSWTNATIGLVTHQSNNVNREATAAGSTLGVLQLNPIPAITPDGKWIAYTSMHDNLITLVAAGGYGVQVANTYLFSNDPSASDYQKNYLVSHTASSSSTAGNNNTSLDNSANLPIVRPAISDDGRFVAFLSSATNLTSTATSSGYNTFVYDHSTTNVTRVTSASIPASAVPPTSFAPLNPTISGDGRYIGYIGKAASEISGLTNENGSRLDALVYDQGSNPGTSTPTRILVSHAFSSSSTTSNDDVYAPVVSKNGSTVLFLSDGTNLLPATIDGHTGRDTNGAIPRDGIDLYAYSLTTPTGYTPLASNGVNATVTLRDPDLPSLTANGSSEISPINAVSDDGRYTVFFSNAVNVVSGQVDANETTDIFLRDNQTNTTKLISGAAGSATTTANGQSANAVISADGKTVLFYSSATNLISGQTISSGTVQLYLYNNDSASTGFGTLKLVSHTSASQTAGANATAPVTVSSSTLLYSSRSASIPHGLALPSLSSDGQYIAYLSNATNLSASNTGAARVNVFLYDRAADTNTLVSHADGATTTGNADATSVSISADGSTIAFFSKATNLLSTSITNGGRDELYLYSRVNNTSVTGLSAGQIRLASHTAASTTTAATVSATLPYGSLPPTLSSNGAYVAYYFGGTNLVSSQAGTVSATNVFRYDSLNNTNTLVSHADGSAATAGNNPTNGNRATPMGPAMSDNGRYIAYANNSTNLLSTTLSGQNGRDHVYLWDADTGANVLVSRGGSATTPLSGGGSAPSISSDGRYVSFADYSIPSNLTHLDCSFSPTVKVRVFDAQASSGTEPAAKGNMFDPSPNDLVKAALAPTALTADGSQVFWVGLAATNITGDRNGNLDVFRDAPSSGGGSGQPPTDITLSTTGVLGLSNQVVGTYTATDADVGQTYTFTLVTGAGSTDNGYFTITGNELKTGSNFPNGTQSSYSIRTRVTDSGSQTYEKTFTITVTNFQPSNVSLSQSTVTGQAGQTVGSLTTTDPDSGQTHTYTLVSGQGSTDNQYFTISGNELKTGSNFPNGGQSSYSIRVKTADSGPSNLSFEKAFTITVSNFPPTGLLLSNANITATANTTVGTFSTSDADSSQTHSYALVSGTGDADNSRFTITGNTLKTGSNFPSGTQNSYTIRVQTTDSGNPALSFVKTFLISANFAPTDIALSSVNVTATANTNVGTLTTTDSDSGQTHTYALVTGTGDSDNALFTISGNTLKTGANFPSGTQAAYSVRIRTTDSGNPSQFYEEAFTINANFAPTDIALSNSNVAAVADATVGTLTTTDANSGQTHSYTLVTGTGDSDNALFTISGNTLRTGASFPSGTRTSYSVRIRTTDSGNPSQFYEEAFTINANFAPTNISLAPTNVYGLPDTTVGTLSTTDPDSTQTHSYSLVSGSGDTDNSFFVISGNALVTSANFPSGVRSTYTVRVRTTDSGTPALSFEKSFTVSVSNFPPSDIALSSTSVAGLPNTDVGTFTTTDPDAGQTHTYSFNSGGTDNGLFAISGDTLRTGSAFPSGLRGTYNISVRSTDSGPGNLYTKKNFAISVSNFLPTDIALSSTSVVGLPSTNVGTLTTSDPDTTQTHTYTLVSGTGSADNALFAISGNVLSTASTFPNGTRSTYNVRIRTTDNGPSNLFYEEAFTITVSNFAPTDIALSPAAVLGFPNTNVGTLTTSDPDSGQTHTYTLVSGTGSTDNSLFTLSGNTLRTASTFPDGTRSTYTVRIRTTDSGAGNLFYEEAITVTVNNFQPTDIALSNNSVLSFANTDVGTLSTSDPDSGQTHAYTLVSGTGSADNSLFTISGNTLKTAASFPDGTRSTYTVRIRTTDNGPSNLFFEEAFTINVSNFQPTDIALSSTAVLGFPNIDVGTLSTSDPDSGQTHAYTLVSGTGSADNSLFTISGNTLKTASTFPDGTRSTYTVRIRTTDSGPSNLFFEEAFTINVGNFQPTDIALSSGSVLGLPNTNVGTLSTSDPDTTQTHTYTLVSGTGSADNALFTISGNTLRTASTFPDGTRSTYTVRIRTTDSGPSNLFYEEAFTITVNNFQPTDIALSNNSVLGFANTDVGTFSTSDPDSGQTHAYTLVSGTGSADNSLFTISGNTLKTAASFPDGTRSTYTVRIRTTDNGPSNLFFEEAFTINVSNFQPTDIALSSTAVLGFPNIDVGTLSTSDPDSGQTHTYALVSGTGSADNSLFTISGNTLKTAGAFPDGVRASYSIRVRTTDNGPSNLFHEEVFTISVGNFQPTDIALSSASVGGLPSATVGSLSTADADTTQSHAYTLVSGAGSADNAFFAISGNTLRTATTFPDGTRASYSVRIRSTDNGPGNLFFEEAFTITINNFLPTDIVLSNNAVDGLPGVNVGSLTTSDPDTTQTHAYTLVSGAGGADNSFFTISGNTLKTAASFPNGGQASYSVRIRSTDSGPGSFFVEEVFTITVANFKPVADAGGSYTVSEGGSVGLNASVSSDPDQPADTLTYSWDFDNDGEFDDATGPTPTFSAASLDGSATVTVMLKVTDAGGLFETDAALIVIDNVVPAVVVGGATDGVVGKPIVIDLSATDVSPADQAAGFVYTISWGDGSVEAVARTAGNGSGILAEHAYTTPGAYTISVTATDKDGGVSAAATHGVTLISVSLLPDSLDPTETALVVGGTSGSDRITFSTATTSGASALAAGPSALATASAGTPIAVTVNGVLLGVFSPTSRIVAYGLGGDDQIFVDAGVSLPTWVYGGDGNDIVWGGGGPDVLLGESGNDVVVGNAGRDLAIGGLGSDRITTTGRDDLLIAGTSAHDAVEVALAAIMAEWTSDSDYATRTANVSGNSSTGANGDYTFAATGAGQSVFDDRAPDVVLGGALDAYFATRGGVPDKSRVRAIS